MLALTVALNAAGGGLGRFTYAAVFPMMQRDLGLSYLELGTLATVNFLGYLACSFAGGLVAARFGYRRTVGVAAALTGAGLIAIGLAPTFPVAVALHLVVGAAEAFVINMAGAVAAVWFGPRYRGLAIGLTGGGVGLGLLLLGGIVAVVGSLESAIGWRAVWAISGVTVVAVGLLSLAFVRNSPADVGLVPFGETTAQPRRQSGGGLELPWYASLLPFLPFFYGILFTSYLTFFKPFLLDVRELADSDVNALWSLVGSLTAFSSVFWGLVSDRLGRLRTIALVLTSQAASVLAFMLLPVAALGPAAFVFGLVSAGFYPSMAATVALWYGPRRLAAVLGLVGTAYGIGQLLAPIIGGAIARASGTMATPLLFGAAGALVGGAGAIFLLLTVGDGGVRGRDGSRAP
ncbi:MAG: MFS transporter [Chloroflexi bacterium]|nr:MFS transporter [Chloroflexota bacterium]